jgi:hypothetical protein
MSYVDHASEPRAWHASVAKGIARLQAGNLSVVATIVQGSTDGKEFSRPTNASTCFRLVCGVAQSLINYYAQALCHLLERISEAFRYIHSTMCFELYLCSVPACLDKRRSRSGHPESVSASLIHRACPHLGTRSFISTTSKCPHFLNSRENRFPLNF